MHASFANADKELILSDFKKITSNNKHNSVAPADDLFHVKIEEADATIKADIETIMNIINATVGAQQMNAVVAKDFNETIHRQYSSSKGHHETVWLSRVAFACLFGVNAIPIYISYRVVRYLLGQINKVDTRF